MRVNWCLAWALRGGRGRVPGATLRCSRKCPLGISARALRWIRALEVNFRFAEIRSLCSYDPGHPPAAAWGLGMTSLVVILSGGALAPKSKDPPRRLPQAWLQPDVPKGRLPIGTSALGRVAFGLGHIPG